MLNRGMTLAAPFLVLVGVVVPMSAVDAQTPGSGRGGSDDLPTEGAGGPGQSEDSSPPPEVDFSGGNDGAVGVSIQTPGTPAPQPSGGVATTKPKCSWVRANLGNSAGNVVNINDIDPNTINEHYERTSDGALGWWRTCPPNDRSFVWVPTSDPPNPLPAASAENMKKIPYPSLNINPAPDVGTFVQLGLWLAINDPGTTSTTASIGNHSATETATFSHVIFDMGNGDTVRCNDLGTPITNLDTREQGPCGYTYTRSSNGEPLTVTVSSHYDITWTRNNGTSGSRPQEVRSVTFPYTVKQIQVVNR